MGTSYFNIPVDDLISPDHLLSQTGASIPEPFDSLEFLGGLEVENIHLVSFSSS